MGEQLRISIRTTNTDSRVKHDSTSAVATSWSLAVGGLTLAEVHQIAGLFVMLTSFVYTMWRWNRDIKNDR